MKVHGDVCTMNCIVKSLILRNFVAYTYTFNLLTNFSAFIRENLKLKDEIGKLQEENSELNEELNKTK